MITIDHGGLWFLGFVFFFGCLTYCVKLVLEHGAWRRGLRPRQPGGEIN